MSCWDPRACPPLSRAALTDARGQCPTYMEAIVYYFQQTIHHDSTTVARKKSTGLTACTPRSRREPLRRRNTTQQKVIKPRKLTCRWVWRNLISCYNIEKTYDTQMAYYQAYGKGIYGKLHTLEDDNASSTSSSEVKLLPTDGSVITKKPQLMKRHSSKNVTKIPSNSSSRLKESSGRPHSTSELDFGHMIPESLVWTWTHFGCWPCERIDSADWCYSL